MYVVHIYGGIAQLARVLGSYPIGRWFKSSCRYQTNLIWPVGQAVKTPPFHGGNRSSILLRVTKKETSELCSDVSFYPSRRLGMESRVSVYGIAIGAWHHRRCIFCGLIPYATASQFHSATRCGFHTRLQRDSDVKGE